jgi:putative glutamine amidotransferase
LADSPNKINRPGAGKEDNMKPVIGIIPSLLLLGTRLTYTSRQNNGDAIADNGGLPLLLPYASDGKDLEGLLSLVDGIYFAGGCDILPSYFGEEPIPTLGDLCPARDAFEIAVYRLAAAKDMPMLGVCRGVQIMNVAAGGSVYQDIYAQLPGVGAHAQKDLPGEYAFHSVNFTPGGKLAGLLGESGAAVNSFHHEAVKEAAPGYAVAATAPDGVIEGIESLDLTYALGVQWHPEYMYGTSPVCARLYRSFVEAAAAYRERP